MSDKKFEDSPWAAVLGLAILAFAVLIPLGLFGVLGDTFGAICIVIMLVVLAIVIFGWLARIFRAANNVIDRNDPKSPRYRG